MLQNKKETKGDVRGDSELNYKNYKNPALTAPGRLRDPSARLLAWNQEKPIKKGRETVIVVYKTYATKERRKIQ